MKRERSKAEISVYNAAYYAAHKAEKSSYAASHKTEREAYVTSTEYKARKAIWDANYYAAHKAEKAAYDADYRRKNPDRLAERARRRYARKQGNLSNEHVTRAHLALLFESQGGLCRYCSRPLDTSVPSWQASRAKHVDHRVPIFRGGSHAPNNVCWACSTCNTRKHTKTESEFLTITTGAL